MKIRFLRPVVNPEADPDFDPVFEADGRFTAESLARIRGAAERGNPVAMANLGTGLSAAGDLAGAMHWLGLAWDAGNVVAGFNLGSVLVAAGHARQARAVWEKCAALGDVDAMLGLIRQAVERGEPASAEPWIEQVYCQNDAFPITAMGFAFAAHGHVPQAVQAYRRAVDLGDGFAMEYLAALLDAEGSPESRQEAADLRLRAQSAPKML